MTFPSAALGVLVLSASNAASAAGFLETPNDGSVQTGIGVISGWHCSASVIQVAIDGMSAGKAGYGTPRADTASVCGSGNTNTGFSLLFNFNLLANGRHSIVATADGVAFGSSSFTSVNLGVEYLTGVAGKYALRNFPAIGTATTVEWSESNQNFSITGSQKMGPAIFEGPRIAGNYYGATGGQYDICDLPNATLVNPKYGRFDVNLEGDQLRVDFNFADGTSCFLAGNASLDSSGFASVTHPTGSCPTDASASIKVDGLRLRGQFRDQACYHFSFFGAKSTFRDQ